jgi:integrase
MVGRIDDATVKGARDRALLLLGFASALRRSELVALDVPDLEACAEGVVLTIGHFKTDQESAGRIVGVPYATDAAICPVRAQQHYLDAAEITSGAIFRRLDKLGRVLGRLTPQSVALLVKAAAFADASARGLSSSEARELAAHYGSPSLRAGYATAAAGNGASERAIMAQTGHRSLAVARRYIRNGSAGRKNAADGLL